MHITSTIASIKQQAPSCMLHLAQEILNQQLCATCFQSIFGVQVPDVSFAACNISTAIPAKVCGYCRELYMYQDH